MSARGDSCNGGQQRPLRRVRWSTGTAQVISEAGAHALVRGGDGLAHRARLRQRWVRCGSANCRQCRDGRGHGPYAYWRWREGAKARESYIGAVS